MNTPTPTPRTDAAWAKTFDEDEDQCRAGNAASDMRDECATLERELAALATERDQLRADCENETKWAAHYLAESIAVKGERDQLRAVFPQICAAIGNGAFCTPTVSVGFIESIPNEVQLVVAELRARAERAEAIVGKLQELHGCSQEMVVHWCEHAANRSLGLDQARSELTAEREKSERYRLATLKLDAELAAERARLDWLRDNVEEIYSKDQHGIVYLSGDNIRSAIDSAMKEDAK
jgi:hypothetical protein